MTLMMENLSWYGVDLVEGLGICHRYMLQYSLMFAVVLRFRRWYDWMFLFCLQFYYLNIFIPLFFVPAMLLLVPFAAYLPTPYTLKPLRVKKMEGAPVTAKTIRNREENS